MSFGDFLLEQKMISEKQLVRALVDQFEQAPSLIKLISHFDCDQEIINAIQLMRTEQKDLISLQREHNIFPQEIFEQALALQLQQTPSLGQLLLSSDAISRGNLQNSLIRYHQEYSEERSEEKSEEGSEPEPEPESEPEPEPEPEPETEPKKKPIPSDGDSAGSLEQESMRLFLQQISDEKVDELNTLLQQIDPDGLMHEEAVEFILNQLTQLQKNAEAMGGGLTVKILQKMTNILHEHQAEPKDLVKLRENLQNRLKLLLSMGEIIEKNHSEYPIQRIPSLLSRIELWCK